VKRGEIYRTRERLPERGDKAGFYVIVSRNFIAGHGKISTVIGAPLYSEVAGLSTEVVVGREDGLPKLCAIRCDSLTLLQKRKLTQFVGTLSVRKMAELQRALRYALDLDT